MTKKTTILILFISLSIISCKEPRDPSISVPIAEHIIENVTTSFGINFDTREAVLLNSFTGNVIDSCGDFSFINGSEEYKKTTKISQNCITKVVNPSKQLSEFLRLTHTPIEGEIERNGKVMKVTYYVTVQGLYPGSDCETVFSGGKQYELCTKLEEKCFVYKDFSIPRRNRYNSRCSDFDFW